MILINSVIRVKSLSFDNYNANNSPNIIKTGIILTLSLLQIKNKFKKKVNYYCVSSAGREIIFFSIFQSE